MLDVTAEALATAILKERPADRAYARNDLSQLPRPVAHYLGRVLDRRVEQKATPPETPWVDGALDELKAARQAWINAAQVAAQFPEDAWMNAVRTASRQVLDFLVDPVATLVSFVFTDSANELDRETLLQRMSSFSPYPYFHEVAEGYVERKELDGVDKTEFEKLLDRIDKRMVSKFGAADWMTLLEPLFEVVNAIPEHKDGVPASLLRQFFEAKGQPEIAATLQGADAYDAAQLKSVLEKSGLAEVSEEAGEQELQSPDSASEDPEASGPEPLWMRLAREKEEGNTQAESVVAPVELPEAEPDPATPEEAEIVVEEDPGSPDDSAESSQEGADGDKPLWKKFAGDEPEDATVLSETEGSQDVPTSNEEEAGRPEPLVHLETRVLGSTATERRDWYMQHLTSGSEVAYRDILESLDVASSWEKAWPILKDAYQANKVEIYSDAIVAFTDAIEARYRA